MIDAPLQGSSFDRPDWGYTAERIHIMPPCRINAKPSKKPISHRIVSPTGRAFMKVYKAVITGLTQPFEPSVSKSSDADSVRAVSRYRAYAPPLPTAEHPAFRHWEGQPSQHPQPLQSHSPKFSMASRNASEISEIDKETHPDFAERWDAEDISASPAFIRTEGMRRDSCQSDLTVEEQVRFASAVPITRAVRKSFYPSPRAGMKLDI